MQEKRWKHIASSIKVAIHRGDLHTGARIASETEMASQWNVSTSTVHHAMTELQREGWIIRRRRIGTTVADRSKISTTKIGLVFTSLSDLPQAMYLKGIEESLAEGCQLLPLGANHSSREELKNLMRAADECSAIICYPTGAPENTPLLKEIAAAMPVIFVDRIPGGIKADVVMTDNYASMQLGLQHLREAGHDRIAYFMEDRLYISSVRERLAAYLDFMKQSQIEDTNSWVRRFPSSMPWDKYADAVEGALIELLSDYPEITAVACQQDATMAAVLEACVNLNIAIPGDIAVLSFADMPTKMQPLARRVNRLVQRPLEMGNMVAKRVQLRLASSSLPVQETRLVADFYPVAEVRPRSFTNPRAVASGSAASSKSHRS